MKKSISLFLTMTAVLTIGFSACGNSQSNTADAPTDMKFVEVQGPVKAIIEGSATTNFDRSGQITSITNNDPANTPYTIQRNSDGQIVKLSFKETQETYGELPSEELEWTYTYTYDALGYVLETTETDPWSCTTFKFTNNGGRHGSARVKMEGKNDRTGIVTYSYPEVDAYGNWTKRKSNVVLSNGESDEKNEYYTSREIVYWEETSSDGQPKEK